MVTSLIIAIATQHLRGFRLHPRQEHGYPGRGLTRLGKRHLSGRTINRSHSPLVAKPRVRCGAVGLAFVRGSHRRVHGPPGSSRGGLGGGECDTRSPFLQSGRQVSAKVDGTRGAVCESSEDEGLRTTILRFSNGDVKKTLPDNRVVYYCASTGTTRTTHPGGLVVVRFPDKRTEKFYPDGSKEILFPDGTVTRLHDGREETVFPDGTLVSVARNGDKTIVFSNGQRDIHTAEFKRRELPRRHRQDGVLRWPPGDQARVREGEGQRRDWEPRPGPEVGHPRTRHGRHSQSPFC
ncbi:hypothetical protein QTO34_000959 [Cnephaeus nilssonii]|uniref:Centromere protein J C-terminal domain-containing protein n=1 Tax=Cnephaeus nilssonii TaxID=3371016 RepID=A0AA40LN85_CNENI|nr:hypothetical protein QTO34_000959 [Eptesicus nilssonii]